MATIDYTYTITDQAGTSGQVTGTDIETIMQQVRAWYPEAPEEVTEVLDQLEAQLSRPIMDLNGIEDYLDIRVDREAR